MRIETIAPVSLEKMESYVKYKGPVMVEIDWTEELENINGVKYIPYIFFNENLTLTFNLIFVNCNCRT